MVELLVHLHDRDARLAIPGQDRVRDRRRATPAGKQRRVHIEHAATRDLQDGRRDDLAVRNDDHQVGRQQTNALHNRCLPDAVRLIHIETQFDRSDLHRRRRHLHAVARPIRLRDHERDLMARGVQGAQRRHGEGSGTGENQLQEGS